MAIVVISTLAAVLLDRLHYYQERAEKAAMEYTLETVRMGLRMRMAELIATNRTAELSRLENDNPMNLLSNSPTGYAGEYVSPPKPGNWYFASRERELVYVPVSRAYLAGGNFEFKELRFRVVMNYRSSDAGGDRSVVGMTLVPARLFRWF